MKNTEVGVFLWEKYCTLKILYLYQQKNRNYRKVDMNMKGYNIDCGYMGYIDGEYRLFSDENDYVEEYRENN